MMPTLRGAPLCCLFLFSGYRPHRDLHSFPTRRSSDLLVVGRDTLSEHPAGDLVDRVVTADVFHIDQRFVLMRENATMDRSEEHTSELQSHVNLVCRLLLEKKKKKVR